MMLIRNIEPHDRKPALDVIASAFGRDDEARLVEILWAESAISFEVVATEKEKIVGYCACSDVKVAPTVDFRVLGLAPLAVAPAKQKQGVGASLVQETLEDVRQAGAGAVVLLGNPAYYARFNFAPASSKSVQWEDYVLGDAFQLIEFTAVFDGKPRKVSYHAAFSGL